MQIREMRFAKIEGTEVVVTVHSATEAKAAIRELKHKKKELALLKKRLGREQAAARKALAREEREKAALARRRGMLASFKRMSSAFRSKTPERGLEEIEREIDAASEIIHNVESCIVQIEGKLLV